MIFRKKEKSAHKEDSYGNKPIKDWGNGIPEYNADDILSGLELHEFCTNIVAQSMQDNGYTIDGIIVNSTPTQVVATKDGQKYFVIVAGGIYPVEGKISYNLKEKFSRFCRQQNVIPMFASVGLMSSDSQRAMTGLALKYDGYHIKYSGNEDLSFIEAPKEDHDDYKAYCVEKIVEAYKTGLFEGIYKFFADDIEFHSQWVLEPVGGKTAVTEYFDGKGLTLRNSQAKISGAAVVITGSTEKRDNIMVISEVGKICALLCQELDDEEVWIFITPEFNDENKLVRLSLNDPAFFSFEDYYAFN